MSQGKRKRDNEPSTSNGSSRNTRKKTFVPESYEYDSDEEILKDFSDSGSEWEATPSEMGSYIADGGRPFSQNVNTSENSAGGPSIQNASITENSDGRGSSIQNNGDNDPLLLMSIVTADNSELSLGETTNTSRNGTTISADNSTIKRGR